MREIYIQRSDSERKARMETELRATFPRLHFAMAEWIGNPNAHLVIDDITVNANGQEVTDGISMFSFYCRKGITVYPITDLTTSLATDLAEFLGKLDPNRTMIILPGEGALTVRNALPKQLFENFPSVIVKARRIKDPETGDAIGVALPGAREDIQTAIEDLPIENILVVDDVIDTGKTIQELQREANIPYAAWSAAAPIMYSPLPYGRNLLFPTSVEGYDDLYAAMIIQGESNPVPLNSLSSFLEGGEKTDRLIAKCLAQYVDAQDVPAFTDMVLQLKKTLGQAS